MDDAMLAVGTQFAGYRIEGFLGRGGMGIVYEATQLSLQRPIALKLLGPWISDDPALAERFRREALLQAKIDHPNVVTVYEAGSSEHGLFIAMRLIRGRTLKAAIQARELSPDAAVRILLPIADALDAAHAAGLVHRDVKPQNILLGPRDHPSLADFGIVTARDDTGAMTQTGRVLGTPDYIAPEQVMGERATPASDIYALAAVLFECLTTVTPFRASTPAAVMYARLRGPPPRPSAERSDLPPAVDDVLARGLARDPGRRPASARALMRDAEQALLLTQPAPAQVPTARPEFAAHRPSRRVAWLLAVGVAAGVATGMLVLGNGGSGGADPPSSPAAYRERVVEVCENVNAADRRSRREAATLRRTLRDAPSTRTQRDAILVATRASISLSGRNLADLRSLEPPANSRILHRTVEQVWDQSLARLRAYAVRVDRSSTGPELLRALDTLSKWRPAWQEEKVTVTAGLQKLGGEGCRIHKFSDRPIPLPPLEGEDGLPDVRPPEFRPPSDEAPAPGTRR
jgi:serine/threonine protein kinase